MQFSESHHKFIGSIYLQRIRLGWLKYIWCSDAGEVNTLKKALQFLTTF